MTISTITPVAVDQDEEKAKAKAYDDGHNAGWLAASEIDDALLMVRGEAVLNALNDQPKDKSKAYLLGWQAGFSDGGYGDE